jgi:hypothetical protein
LGILLVFVPFILISALIYIFGQSFRAWVAGIQTGQDYIQLTNKDFEVWVHSEDKEYAGIVLETLDKATRAFYKGYKDALGLKPLKYRISVRLFRTHEEFRQYGRKRLMEELEFNSGFFYPVQNEIVLIIQDRGRLDREGLIHEMVHAILYHSAPRAELSNWLSEGLATYLAVYEPRSNKLGGLDYGYIELAKRMLIQGKDHLNLRRLLEARPEDFKGQKNRVFYALSHALVGFLIQSPLRQKFFNYIKIEKRPGRVSRLTFEVEIGELNQVEKGLKEWLKQI